MTAPASILRPSDRFGPWQACPRAGTEPVAHLLDPKPVRGGVYRSLCGAEKHRGWRELSTLAKPQIYRVCGACFARETAPPAWKAPTGRMSAPPVLRPAPVDNSQAARAVRRAGFRCWPQLSERAQAWEDEQTELLRRRVLDRTL